MARWHDYQLTMIPFFRKIRYKQAKDNQFFKYSRYAIGEIVLVVIGILIALQINNWNEKRKDNNKRQFYIQSLQNDLKKDTAQIRQKAQSCAPGICIQRQVPYESTYSGRF